jgi:hypothetical protein
MILNAPNPSLNGLMTIGAYTWRMPLHELLPAILTLLLIHVSRQSLLRNPYFATHPCVTAILTSLLIHVSRQFLLRY